MSLRSFFQKKFHIHRLVLRLVLGVILLTLAMPQPVQAARRACAYNYTVKKRDTFYSIALSFAVSRRELARVNSISTPWYVEEGQVLCIPRAREAYHPH